jgi:phosphoserine phosphatase
MKKLIVFDAHGVLVKERSSWIAVHRGLGKEVIKRCSKLKKEYLSSGKMSYEIWAKKDVKLWGEVGLKKIKKILNKVPFMKGAKETCKALKERGYLLAIISTGINLLIERIKKELNVDYAICNEIYERNSKLFAKINVSDDKKPKDKILKKIIKKLKIKKQNIVVIGDSDDDLPMMKLAGFSILFNPHPTNSSLAKKYANVIIPNKDLKIILQYL